MSVLRRRMMGARPSAPVYTPVEYVTMANTMIRFCAPVIINYDDTLILKRGGGWGAPFRWPVIGNSGLQCAYVAGYIRWFATNGLNFEGNPQPYTTQIHQDLATCLENGNEMALTNATPGYECEALGLNTELGNPVATEESYYLFQILRGDVPLVDLIPVLDQAGTPCFFDRVSQRFCYPEGPGTAEAGPIRHIQQGWEPPRGR